MIAQLLFSRKQRKMEYITAIFLNMRMLISISFSNFKVLIYLDLSRQLCQWLWPKLLRKLAKEFMESRNAFKSRLNHSKPGPSGMSRNEGYSLPHKWGGRQCLLEVDLDVVREMKDFFSNGEDLFRFPLVTSEFEIQAEEVYEALNIQDLSLSNVWNIFSAMFPSLFS